MQLPDELEARLEEAGVELEGEHSAEVIEEVIEDVEALDEPGAEETGHLLRRMMPSVETPTGDLPESDGGTGVREGYGSDLVDSGSD